jgi:hypothetical protein
MRQQDINDFASALAFTPQKTMALTIINNQCTANDAIGALRAIQLMHLAFDAELMHLDFPEWAAALTPTQRQFLSFALQTHLNINGPALTSTQRVEIIHAMLFTQ